MVKVTSLNELDKYYQQVEKESLKITMIMGSPLVMPTHFLHLDAILTDLVAKRFHGHEPNRWNDFKLQEYIPLPLERYGKTNKVWKASVAYSEGMVSNYESIWSRRGFDKYAGSKRDSVVWGKGVLSDEQIKAGSVNFEKAFMPTNDRSSGAYRNFFEKHKVNRSDKIVFFAKGNKEELKKLLSDINFIGKRRGVGYGRVVEVLVEPIQVDYSLIDMNGYPARVIPLEEVKSLGIKESKMTINFNTFKPSYANPKHRTVCVTPCSNLPHIEEGMLIQKETDEFDEDYYFL